MAFLATGNACSHTASTNRGNVPQLDRLPLSPIEPRSAWSDPHGYRDSVRLVVRDSVQWLRLWATLQGRRWPQTPPPAIDFSREVLLVSSLGYKPQGVYHMAIDSAVHRGSVVEVHVSYSAEPSCKMIFSPTNPMDMARLPMPSERIVFVDHIQPRHC
jgi:hypothetical protein